jgi:hypothetical protein
MTDTIRYNRSNSEWQDAGVAVGLDTDNFIDGSAFIASGTSGRRPDGVKWVVISISPENGNQMCQIVWINPSNSQMSFDFLSLAAVQAMRGDDASSVGISLPQ